MLLQNCRPRKVAVGEGGTGLLRVEKIIGQYWVPGLIDGCFVAGGCSVDYNGPGCDESIDGEMVRASLWPGCVVARPIPGMPKDSALNFEAYRSERHARAIVFSATSA